LIRNDRQQTSRGINGQNFRLNTGYENKKVWHISVTQGEERDGLSGYER
jgi:hypothetical protein